MSPFWSRYFRAYLPYDATNMGLLAAQLDALAADASAEASLIGAYTDTGQCYQAAIFGQQDSIPPDHPFAPSTLLAEADAIHLSWANGVDNVGVAGYDIYRNDQKIATTTRSDYMDQGLDEATTYSYRIVAFDAFANYSLPSPATTESTPDVTSPAQRGGLTANAISATEITVTWEASADNVATTGYRVIVGLSPASLKAVKLVASPTYTQANLPPGFTVYIAVDAIDAALNISERSATVSGTTLADTEPPSVPTGLVATSSSPTQLDLS